MDLAKKHKKSLPLSGNDAILHFLFDCLLVVPFCLLIVLPFTLVYQGLLFVYNKTLAPKKQKQAQQQKQVDEGSHERLTAASPRKFDLVLFGATGFTGKMAAKYLAKSYNKQDIRWTIAGRNRAALEKIKAELSVFDSKLSSVDVIIADSTDPISIRNLVCSTKVILATAGPFDKYGSDVVKYCAQNGTHYCDITGETDWVRRMIDLHDEEAKSSGANIVHFCGHDCVPWDLAVLECANALKKEGEQVESVHIFDELNANMSGGTLATIFHSLDGRTQYKAALPFDPLLKTRAGCKGECATKTANTAFLSYSNVYKHWVGPFVMAAVMANCIRRSNAVLNYGPKLKYVEASVYPNFMAGVVQHVFMLVVGLSLVCPPLKHLLLATGMLPHPGEGPSEAEMDKGYLNVTIFATGTNGGRVKTQFYFPTDPGYRDTARILVESGLCLALQDAELKTKGIKGGIATPATCQGTLLTQRLLNSGSELLVEKLEKKSKKSA